MANPTDDQDPRIRKIQSSQVYGLYHGPMLIYVGATKLPLDRRENLHAVAARSGQDRLPVAKYIRKNVDDPREELEVKELPYDSEEEALSDLANSTLNAKEDARGVSGGDLYDWTSAELDVLENLGLRQAARQLDGPSYTDCRVAARKIGSCRTISRHLSNAAVREIWTRYHALEDATYESVAAHFDVSPDAVGGIIRREHYTDVDLPSKTAINAHHALSQD